MSPSACPPRARRSRAWSRAPRCALGQSTGTGNCDHRNGDQEDDQQHQHHVDQRRGVDGGMTAPRRPRRMECSWPWWRSPVSQRLRPRRCRPGSPSAARRRSSRTSSITVVAPHEPVVAQHRGHGDGQADGGHDERLAHRAGHLVDRRLAGDADGGQRVVDAPDGAEQADEGAVEPTVASSDMPLLSGAARAPWRGGCTGRRSRRSRPCRAGRRASGWRARRRRQ
jgi:hypothetical protein